MAVRTLHRTALALALLTLAGTAVAQTQVYRYTDPDGRIVYSDRAPPGSAKNVQPKRLGANYIETSQLPLAAQQAVERFPVTLYTYDCGEVCQNAEALLNKRGVPYTVVDVQRDEQGLTRMKSLSGEDRAPVLALGEKIIVKGYSEPRWQAALDEAGYPKTPAQRRSAVGGATGANRDVTPPPPVEGARAVTPQPKGGDYPK